jgi:hypothetical protein
MQPPLDIADLKHLTFSTVPRAWCGAHFAVRLTSITIVVFSVVASRSTAMVRICSPVWAAVRLCSMKAM